MRFFSNATSLVPAGVFLGFAVFFVFKILLSLAPSNPLSWQLYLSISPFYREPAVVLGAIDPLKGAALAALAGLVGLLMAGKQGAWLRARFFYAHAALFVVFAGLLDEKVFSAGLNGGNFQGSQSPFIMPDFTRAEPVAALLFFVVAFACLRLHRRLIWNMRHPLRKVAPLAL